LPGAQKHVFVICSRMKKNVQSRLPENFYKILKVNSVAGGKLAKSLIAEAIKICLLDKRSIEESNI